MNKIKSLVLVALLILLTNSVSISQSLVNGPESVAFDSLNNRYLVSSLLTSKVISIDKNGNQEVFKNNIAAYGNCIKDSILFVAGNSTVRGLNVFSGEDVFSVTIPGTQQLDGITFDNSGHLYVMATRIGKVYKINIETKAYTAFVDGGFGRAPQDLIFDKFNNRVLVCHWSADSPIMSINLADSTMNTVVEKTAGYADGITIDHLGNIYVTSHNGEGAIYKYENDFSKHGELIYVGIEEPAGLDYNIIDDVLAVPSFSGDIVVFIDMPSTYLFPKIGVNYTTGNAPLTLEFSDLSSSNPKVNSWEWDFNNDGVIDSYEQNPTWIYEEPGIYKVKAYLISDSLSDSVILEDSIIIFEGESSMNFINAKSVVKVAPTQELNLKDNWTFEAWLNPTSLHGKYILDKNNLFIYTNRRSSGLNSNSLVVKFAREDNSTIRFTTEDSSLTLDKWQHLAISYNYSNKNIDIYIDGKHQELSIDNNSIFESPIKTNELDTMLLGNNYSGVRSLRGRLDEIRIWQKALSKEEIDANRFTYLTGNENNLVAYWNINEGNGETIFDLSNNNNNGKIIEVQFDWGIDYYNLVGVKNQSNNASYPNSFSLQQNYPNPFNPSTTIKYAIPFDLTSNNETNVTLNIYNALGQEIATLVNKHQKAGNYSVNFNANNLTSGVYYYRLQSGIFGESKKMILVK